MSFFHRIFNKKEQEKSDPVTQASRPHSKDEKGKENGSDRKTGDGPSPEEQTEDETEYEVVEREILPHKIICPDCGGITLEGLEFCDKCGGELL